MGKWRNSVITVFGETLLAEAVAGDSVIEFVKVSIGCGKYSADELSAEYLKEQTTLKESKNEYGISSLSRDDNVITLKVLMNNSSVSSGYYVTELGLWCRRNGSNDEPKLYSIILADRADYFPDSTSPTTIKQALQMVTSSNDVKVCIAENMGAYVDVDDFAEFQNRVLQDLDEKAPIENPDLTGIPKAPTASTGTNTLQIANTAFVQSTVSDHNDSDEAHSDIRKSVEELKKSVSDGKSGIASAITEMGVATSSDAAYSTMSDNIKKIKATLSRAANVVKALINGKNEVSLTIPKSTVTKSGIWNGATYTVTIDHTEGYVDGGSESQVVTLTNQAAVTKSPSNAVQTLFAAGSRVYFAGDYKISAVSISGGWNGATYTVDANGASASITLATQTAKTITPSTAAQTAVASGNRFYFSGDLKVDSLGGNATAANVRSGYTFSSNNAGRAVSGTMKNYTIVYQQGSKFKPSAGYYLSTAYSNNQDVSGALISTGSNLSLVTNDGNVTVTFANGTGSLFFWLNEDTITLSAGTYVILYSVIEWGDTNRKNTVSLSFTLGVISPNSADGAAPTIGRYAGSSGFDSGTKYYIGEEFTISSSTTYKIKGYARITSNPNNYNCQLTVCGVTILKIT